MAKFLYHQFGGIGVQRLSDGRHHAHLHQRLDDVAGPCGHAVGQFLHGNRVRQNNVAHDLHLVGAKAIQFGLTALALALTANRGERTDVFVLALDRGLHVDASRAAASVPFSCDDWGFARQQCRPGRRTGRPSSSSSRVPGRRRSVSVGAAGVAGSLPGRPGAPAGPARQAHAARRGWRLRLPQPLRPPAAPRPRPPACCVYLRLPGRLFRRPFGPLLATPRFLGGGEDGDLLLFAAFRFALGSVALLLHQGALTGGLFGGGQCAPGAGPAGRGRWSAVRRRRRRGGDGGAPAADPGRRRGALLAHFNLHDL